jgi:hypothetical protein
MHRGLSLWLDVLRAVATLVVVFPTLPMRGFRALCVGHVNGMGRLMQNARFDLPVMRWIAGGVFRPT